MIQHKLSRPNCVLHNSSSRIDRFTAILYAYEFTTAEIMDYVPLETLTWSLRRACELLALPVQTASTWQRRYKFLGKRGPANHARSGAELDAADVCLIAAGFRLTRMGVEPKVVFAFARELRAAIDALLEDIAGADTEHRPLSPLLVVDLVGKHISHARPETTLADVLSGRDDAVVVNLRAIVEDALSKLGIVIGVAK